MKMRNAVIRTWTITIILILIALAKLDTTMVLMIAIWSLPVALLIDYDYRKTLEEVRRRDIAKRRKQ